ncbi:MAG TPA: hypothetical protein VFV99_31100 [Kofleriaceae bacterium]|nr:hypothetical protein [Kofleriaceae bacterium]
MHQVVIIALPLAVLAWARSVRVTIAFAVATAVMWVSAAVLADWFFNQPEIFATLVFAYFLLPFVIAPICGVLAAVLIGPPRHLFASGCAAVAGCIGAIAVIGAAGPIVDLRECFHMMAAPTLLAICAATLVAVLAQRRV